MESEDKRQIHHPPGHENHGVHVCHKCGWAFPNPHPSAKHRRAHKKVCGKIEGFKRDGSEDKSHSDSDSDEDHRPSNSIAQGSVEKVSVIVAEGTNKSEEEVFSDAVAEFADAESRHTIEEVVISNKMPQPNDLMHGNQIQNLHALEDKTDQLDSSVPLQDHALHSTPDAIGASISYKKINSAAETTQGNSSGDVLLSFVSALEPKTSTNDSMENPNISSGEDVSSYVAVVGPDTDAEAHGESTEGTTGMGPTTQLEVSSDFTNSSTIATMDYSSMDTVMDLKVPEPTIFHAHEEQANALGQQKPQSEMSPRTQLSLLEVEAGDHLGASVDTNQVPKGSLQTDNRVEVDGTTAENLPVFSILEDLPARDISEMKYNACKDPMPMKPEVTPTLTGIEEMESKEVHCSGPVLEEAHSGFMSIKSGESADVFPTTVQVQEDNLQVNGPGSRSISKELIVDQSGAYEDLNEEGSQSVGINSSECAIKELQSDGLRTPSDSSKAFTSDDVVMGSCEVDATQSHSEDDKPASSLGELEPHHGFSRDIMPETAPISEGSITGSAAETVVYQEITKESGGYNVVHEETGPDHASIVSDYSEEGTNDEKSLSRTRTIPESAINITEMKPQFVQDARMNEVEGNLQLTEGTHTDTTVSSRGLDIDSSSLEKISDNFSNRQDRHNEVFQESSKELAADSFSDPSVVKTEKEVEKIETSSSSQEKLDQSSEVCLYQFDAENPTPEEPVGSAVDTESCVQSSFTLDNGGTKNLTDEDVCEGGDTILKQDVSASVLTADASVDSISQTDSVEGYWGSVSDGTVPSTRDATDTKPILSTQSLPDIDVQTPKEASVPNSKKQNLADNTDICEAPSFMTLVEPNRSDSRQQASAEIESIQNPQYPSSPTSQIGWFPSLTNIVNESQGRKKNEEIIAKVVNWSSGKPHTPLRSLLVDANLEIKHKASPTAQDDRSPKTYEGPASEDEGAPAKTALEVSAVPAANEVAEKEWNSPARLPVIKREKRKVRGYWVPFVCCSSTH